MRRLRFALAAILAGFTSSSFAQIKNSEYPLLEFGQPVYTDNDNGELSGSIGVSYSGCATQPRINQGFGFSKVHNLDEIFNRLRQPFTAWEKEAERIDAACKK